MSVYGRVVFPRLCDWALSRPAPRELRRRLIAQAAGAVVEPGLGTGLNLALYPAAVGRVDAVDPNAGMRRIAEARARRMAVSVRVVDGVAEHLPFPDSSYDTAVLTWTLCSVEDPLAALAELRRVLKPGGRLLLLEHGLCPTRWAAAFQRAYTPVQRLLADGCRLDRPVRTMVEGAAFRFEDVAEFRMDGAPRVFGWTTMGAARPI